MKKFLLVLVVANALAFAWWRGWFDDWLAAGRDPQRAAGQVAADKVRVVPYERYEAARTAARSPAPCPEGQSCEPARDSAGDGDAARPASRTGAR